MRCTPKKVPGRRTRRLLAAAVYAQVRNEYQAGFVAMLRSHATAEDSMRGGVAHHLRWVAANRSEAALLLGDRLDSAELRDAKREFFAAMRDWWRAAAMACCGPNQGGRVMSAAEPLYNSMVADGDDPDAPRRVSIEHRHRPFAGAHSHFRCKASISAGSPQHTGVTPTVLSTLASRRQGDIRCALSVKKVLFPAQSDSRGW
ncbi:hypothetical protein [Candidatus Mycobacterium methanotrophicum]|uniref:Uncharacterized protein n=1 Tax=Candidatus Mycobacterium methanotrophicum TaxID=2943498 RepID=A0ABY4QN08_9MYCO|nr:hypothetical protein [Candidatus Mycobacterium methanotrophicum]UQX12402.1 hypothetical protein M5I08_09225 [Candidatus Mycobacterium methanotrophicum]